MRSASAAVLYYRLGRWDEAIAEAEAGDVLSREVGVRLGVGWLAGIRALVLLHRGYPDQAAAILSEQAPDLYGPTLGMDWMALARASVDLATGNDQLAFATLTMAIDLAASVGAKVSVTYLGIEATRLALALGDEARVTALAAAVDEMRALSGVPTTVAPSEQIHGLIDGDDVRIVGAATIFESLPRPWDAARAMHDAALVAAVRGDHGTARDHAYAAVRGYQAVGAEGSITQLRADLRPHKVQLRIVASVERSDDAWDQLTQTEAKVAGFVGEGLTNAEIGGRLYVSRRTVESHLGRVYQKLGIGSRAMLAKEAAERSAGRGDPGLVR
jgi:DNA-binding CsgD family transcriptional regulator